REAADVPTEPRHLTLKIHGGVADSFLDDLREVVRSFPGDHELRLEIGARRLVLGQEWRVSSSSACVEDLSALEGVGLG
ncbi:MAG TPA: hypothetical protein VGR10_00525, partial [Thermoleophilaceae bacterium]|nr:hypothetical protein [Thermoleophilaceae bacterium]